MKGALIARGVLAGILLIGFAAAGVWSIRVGLADYYARQGTVAGARRAIALTPDRADWHVLLAELLAEQDPAGATAALQRAAALNPLDASVWIALGLRAEAQSDNGKAEQYYLRAAEVDAKFLPRWTLANFYLRHDNTEKFWYWAKAAVPMMYGDATPFFRLCGRITEDGNLIDRLEIRKPEIQAQYLSYLLGQGQIDVLDSAARHVLENHREADTPLLLAVCDRLLADKHTQKSLELWNRLAEERRIPFEQVGTAAGKLLTNANFTVEPTSHGFDWRLPAVEGVSVSRQETPPGLRLAFSGKQPEACELLLQFIPVQPDSGYEMTYTYRTSDIDPNTGISWQVLGGEKDQPLTTSESLSSQNETTGRLFFKTAPRQQLARLSLRYQRMPGTTRIEGYLVLRELRLKPAQLPSDVPRSRVMK